MARRVGDSDRRRAVQTRRVQNQMVTLRARRPFRREQMMPQQINILP
jgi:hypothetical protein